MPDFKIRHEDGLVTTTVHGMSQTAYVVTEEKVESFNSYSFEFQIVLTLFGTSLGVLLGSLDNLNGKTFAISTVVTILLSLALIWSWRKFSRVKNNLFIKPQTLEEDAPAQDTSEAESGNN